jgi:hypothetical protein
MKFRLILSYFNEPTTVSFFLSCKNFYFCLEKLNQIHKITDLQKNEIGTNPNNNKISFYEQVDPFWGKVQIYKKFCFGYTNPKRDVQECPTCNKILISCKQQYFKKLGI